MLISRHPHYPCLGPWFPWSPSLVCPLLALLSYSQQNSMSPSLGHNDLFEVRNGTKINSSQEFLKKVSSKKFYHFRNTKKPYKIAKICRMAHYKGKLKHVEKYSIFLLGLTHAGLLLFSFLNINLCIPFILSIPHPNLKCCLFEKLHA